jgi:DNA-binding LacI/PurR family transcriptional regulator
VQINDKLCHLLEQNFVAGEPFYSEQDITRALGVSRITVRRVIDDMDKAGRLVRQPGRKAIVAGIHAAENGTAIRACSRSRVSPNGKTAIRTIVMVGLAWNSEFVLEVVEKLTAACNKHSLELKVRMLQSSEVATFAGSLRSTPEEEGFLLFVGSRVGRLLYRSLSERGYQTVSIDAMSPDYEGNVVTTDVRYAMKLAVDHLAELGHERIVLLVNEPIEQESVVDKVVEFKRLVLEKGLSGRVVVASGSQGEDAHDTAYAHMPEVWADGKLRPTAIITVSDPGAWAAQKWLREMGVKTPEEVSIVGYENARSSSYVAPRLTTIAHPIDSLVERVLAVLTGSNASPHQAKAPINEVVKPILIVRESTAPAPKD